MDGRDGDTLLHSCKRRLKIMAWAASASCRQGIQREQLGQPIPLVSKSAGLEFHARHLHMAKERDGCVSCLRLCVRFCFEQHGGSTEEVADDAAAHEERRCRLVRLLSPFREEPTKWELAARRLCQAGAHDSAGIESSMATKDAVELHHLLGLAYLTCGREPCSNDVKEAFHRASECIFRDGLALGGGGEVPYSAQAELHKDLALLYTDMYLLSQLQSTSLLTAGAWHLSRAADCFAAFGRYDRESQVMLAAGNAQLHLEEWESALDDYERSFSAAKRMRAIVLGKASCRRREWRTKLGARFHSRAGDVERTEQPGESAAVATECNGDEGTRRWHTLPQNAGQGRVGIHRRQAFGKREADGLVRICAAGVVEALMRLQREDEALLIADHFLSNRQDVQAILQAHEARIKDCAWIKCCHGGSPGVWRERGGNCGCCEEGCDCRGDGVLLNKENNSQNGATRCGSDARQAQVAEEVADDANVWGDETAACVRQMLDGSSDGDTFVVVFYFLLQAAMHERPGQDPWMAPDEKSCSTHMEISGESSPALLGLSRGGYAWTFQAGKRPRPRKVPPAFGASPSSTHCVRYTASDVDRISRAAAAFHSQCGDFRGKSVGSIEFGRAATAEGVSRLGGPACLAATLKEVSEALGLSDRIMPRVAQCAASRLLVVANGALEGLPLATLPMPDGTPWWNHFERKAIVAPSLAFACIARALQQQQQPPPPPKSSTESEEDAEAQGGKRAWRVVSVGASAVFSSWEAKRVLQAFETYAQGGECLCGDSADVDEIRWATRPARRRPHLVSTPDLRGPRMDSYSSSGGEPSHASDAAETVLHLACHGRMAQEEGHGDDGSDDKKGLQVADCQILSITFLREWDLRGCPLVVMSACSSVLFPRIANQSSLPGAFLYAGCPSVVGALWDVPGASTAALMLTFYHELLSKGLGVAQALAAAQAWLRQANIEDVVALLPPRGATAARLRGMGLVMGRPPVSSSRSVGRSTAARKEHEDSKPFSSPFYWAGFVVVGQS